MRIIGSMLFLFNKLFLSKAERDYLTASSEVSGGYSRVIKSRLQKKLEMFVNQELPILIEKGYLDVTEFRNVTENSNALVAQPGRARLSFENTKNNENKSPSRDLNPGPKVSAPSFRIMERRDYETFAFEFKSLLIYFASLIFLHFRYSTC
jgi:hypothetical protein